MRDALAQDRVIGAATLGVGADADPGDAQDRLDVRLVHAVDDDVDREPVVGEGVERELGGVAAEVVRDGLRASGRSSRAATRCAR